MRARGSRPVVDDGSGAAGFRQLLLRGRNPREALPKLG